MKLRGLTYWILGVVLIFCSCGAGQGGVVPAGAAGMQRAEDSSFVRAYPFVQMPADTVYDPSGSLRGFYALLGELDRGFSKRVNIIHFGDSHIQGGSLSEAIMRNLHLRFGNAGRGMIVPHKLSGSNEPRDYSIKAAQGIRWESMRVNTRGVGSVGITGVAVRSPVVDNSLKICALPALVEDGLNYSFNKVRIFHGKYAPIIAAAERYTTGISSPELIYDFNTDIELIDRVDSLELRTYGDGEFARGPIYGFCLENGDAGVLYHAMGVNSACYVHWGRQTEVVRQTVALEPDLIILSMGSNEASGSNFVEHVFYNEVDRFVRPLREANPEAAIVLTSPAEAFKKGHPNRNFEKVANVLKRYAQEKSVAYVDVYGMTGGAGSAAAWAANDLMGRDKIHYTKEGYRIQGYLIYNALYNGYSSHAGGVD